MNYVNELRQMIGGDAIVWTSEIQNTRVCLVTCVTSTLFQTLTIMGRPT